MAKIMRKAGSSCVSSKMFASLILETTPIEKNPHDDHERPLNQLICSEQKNCNNNLNHNATSHTSYLA